MIHCCCCSVAKSCSTLCNPINCSTPGFPVLHYLPELAKIYIHWVNGHPTILLSVVLLSSIRIFSSVSALHIKWPKYWSFSFNISHSNEYSGLISFRMDWLDLLAVEETQESSPTPQFKNINSSVLSVLYGPTLTSIHDHRKNHSLD